MTTTFGPYTPIRWIGDTGYISGQVGIDPATKTAPPDLAGQIQQLFNNLTALLTAENLSLDNIIKTTIFLVSIDDFNACNELYQSYFTPPRPARTTVGVASLPKIADNTLLVEIEAVVYRPSADGHRQINS